MAAGVLSAIVMRKQQLALTARRLLTDTGKPSAAGRVRNAVTTSTGAIYPKPEKVSFGLLRVFTVVVPFLYIGTLISKNFAALLEEHDIFVPEDDDDDD